MADRLLRRWSAAEDATLRAQWGNLSAHDLAVGLGRSTESVYARAQRLLLPVGKLAQQESIVASARRTGYDPDTLVGMLACFGIGWRRSAGSRGQRLRLVDRRDVDKAIKLWQATETVQGAARTRGLCHETLRDWLKKAGALKLRVPGKRNGLGHWRVESSVINAVVAENLSRPGCRVRVGGERRVAA
jgi:hypothetical protein